MEKVKKEKAPKQPKIVLSEAEIIQKEAHKMLNSLHKLRATTKEIGAERNATAVELWRDTDFYFSVVFKSQKQKNHFLEEFNRQFNISPDLTGEYSVQIINGLALAKSLGIELNQEIEVKFPYPDLELRALALDGEKF